jgi:hypothetical protein
MLQVVEINAIEHLEAIRLRWTSLHYETTDASFFHTLDGLNVYWRHFRHGQRLRVLLIHRDGTIIGILPLVLRREMTETGPVDVLTYPTIMPSQFLGPIGPNPTATLMAALRYLARRSRDWDILSLGEIGEHDLGRTANALELAGLSPHETIRASIDKVCLDVSPTESISIPKPDAATARQGENPIGDLTFERIRPLGKSYDDYQNVGGIVDACGALKPRSSSCGHPVSLLRDVAAVASQLGMLDLNLLRLGNRLIAYSLNTHVDGAIQQISAGEISTTFPIHPTTVLTRWMMQDSILRKDRSIYFAGLNDVVANAWVTQRLSLVRYRHRASLPLRDRLTRFGRWLASPSMKG